ncbi:hypothetical protein SAY87_026703 [Trapa incisa]|uniref:Dirigent protein n=1 Tax=Trapa incisa TaxID=236973 RepID=A0AAN7GUW9_9MYRT|nr:hypothetical protein SAY87_026703 [Trapa incisa]
MASHLKWFALLAILMAHSGHLIPVKSAAASAFSRTISPESLGLRREKLTHLHFYFHDIVSGPNATAITVAQASNRPSATNFGSVLVLDDLLTEGPSPESRSVGRAQGIYASASQTEFALLMALNFVFTTGKYNGSTLTVLGRNSVLQEVREMPVLGGSGLFRFARGYAQLRTVTLNLTTLDAILEFNIYVFHY